MQINLNKLHNVISNGHLMEEIKQLAVCAAFCSWVFSTCRLFAANKFQTNLAVCFSSIFKWKINLFTAFYWIYAHLTTGSLDTAQREIKCVLTCSLCSCKRWLVCFSFPPILSSVCWSVYSLCVTLFYMKSIRVSTRDFHNFNYSSDIHVAFRHFFL